MKPLTIIQGVLFALVFLLALSVDGLAGETPVPPAVQTQIVYGLLDRP